MNSIRNRVQLIGHLGKAPEKFTFQEGHAMTKITLATNESYKDKNGELQKVTQWHNVVAWGACGALMAQHLDKGHEVAITGKLTYRSYKNKEGDTRHTTEVVANEFMKLTRSDS